MAQGSSFTYQDVLAGLVGYMPAGPSVAVDEFQFSLTDGLHMDTGRLEIYTELLPTGDPLHLAVNRGLQLLAGTMGMEESGRDFSIAGVQYFLPRQLPGRVLNWVCRIWGG